MKKIYILLAVIYLIFTQQANAAIPQKKKGYFGEIDISYYQDPFIMEWASATANSKTSPLPGIMLGKYLNKDTYIFLNSNYIITKFENGLSADGLSLKINTTTALIGIGYEFKKSEQFSPFFAFAIGVVKHHSGDATLTNPSGYGAGIFDIPGTVSYDVGARVTIGTRQRVARNLEISYTGGFFYGAYARSSNALYLDGVYQGTFLGEAPEMPIRGLTLGIGLRYGI